MEDAAQDAEARAEKGAHSVDGEQREVTDGGCHVDIRLANCGGSEFCLENCGGSGCLAQNCGVNALAVVLEVVEGVPVAKQKARA